jgi:transcriptional regulator with XRE-family HTH domain
MPTKSPYDPAITLVVAEMRRRRDLSLREISARSGVSKGTLSRLDNGVTRYPHHLTLVQIWKGLGYELPIAPLPMKGKR